MKYDPIPPDSLPFYFGDEKDPDYETDWQHGPVPNHTGRQKQAYAPRYRHKVDESHEYVYNALHVDSPVFQAEFKQFCKENYHPEDAFDTINPYTNTIIDSERAYLEYLREHFYYCRCCIELEKQLAVKPPPIKERVVVTRSDTSRIKVLEAKISSLTCDLDKATAEKESAVAEMERHLAMVSETSLVASKSAEIENLNLQLAEAIEKNNKLKHENDFLLTDSSEKNRRISGLYEEKLHTEKVYSRIALVLLALCIACGFFFYHKGSKTGYIEGESAGYDSGYNVGHAEGYESGHEAGASDGYDRGYDFGYSAGERDASRSSTYPSGSTNTGNGSTRDTAIADGYIGNLNSHKFHYSWCSYLPDQENQIVFSSRDAAVSAGYTPCGRCHP